MQINGHPVTGVLDKASVAAQNVPASARVDTLEATRSTDELADGHRS